jgi:hypothetical protein
VQRDLTRRMRFSPSACHPFLRSLPVNSEHVRNPPPQESHRGQNHRRPLKRHPRALAGRRAVPRLLRPFHAFKTWRCVCVCVCFVAFWLRSNPICGREKPEPRGSMLGNRDCAAIAIIAIRCCKWQVPCILGCMSSLCGVFVAMAIEHADI